jgi:hypothetical protein
LIVATAGADRLRCGDRKEFEDIVIFITNKKPPGIRSGGFDLTSSPEHKP